MNRRLLITLGIIGVVAAASQVSYAEVATQDVQVDTSGGIILKSQRQQKSNETHQSAIVKKSGGIIVIIQRNINKFKCEDLKKATEEVK
jgi:hypothetical protein